MWQQKQAFSTNQIFQQFRILGFLLVRFNLLPGRIRKTGSRSEIGKLNLQFPGLTGWKTEL